MMRSFVALCLLALLSFVASGCGKSHGPMGKVSGTVTYQGSPIPEGTIIFEVPRSRAAYGTIVNGEITELTTFHPGDGVPVGTAKIAVFADQPGGEAANPAPTSDADPGTLAPLGASYMGVGTSLVPAKFNNPATSGLAAEISSGTNSLTLELVD